MRNLPGHSSVTSNVGCGILGAFGLFLGGGKLLGLIASMLGG